MLDLAAGTGQLSRLLGPFGMRLVAVEPASNMRAVLQDRLPSVPVVAARAGSLPFRDGVVGAIGVGNAFHHFDHDAAFAELQRVLRRGGVVGLFWAWPLEEEHLAIPGMREIFDAVEATRTDSAISAAYRAWAEPPRSVPGFGPFERREFPSTHVLPAARLADLYATSSDLASLPSTVLNELIARIRTIAASFPATLRLPSRTVVDLCVRR